MKLPFFNRSKKIQEVFLGLFLKEDQGTAILMMKELDVIKIKEKVKFNYTNGWENLTDDVDEVLYRLEKNHQVQISKTIFFVYSHLVDKRTNDIKKPYIIKIKDLVKNLELEAMGYIECFEAVSLYLEKKEEAPLTAVVLELDKKQLSLFIYKGGKVSFQNVIARTDNIIDDFMVSVEGLKEKKLLLPSRIIIYDSENIDDVATKIIGHKWDGDYFVQIPKISTLKEDEVIDGLVQVFSGQTSTQVENTISESTQSFGFVIGQDVKEEEQEIDKSISLSKVEEVRKRVNFNFSFKFPKLQLPVINLNFIKGKIAVFIGIVFIFLSIFLNELFFHKAKITVYLPTQTIEKKLTESVIYQVATAEASFSETVATTGKKAIGDKAKGTVTVHNFDDKEKIFTKGTTIEASGIIFTLDSDIKVASSSIAADGSAKLPGKSNVSITSQNIGSEGNLSKNSRFKFADLSTTVFFAINENALSGGSKREVRTVSSNDLENLKKIILEKAKKSIKVPNISADKEIISDLSETKFIEEKYSKEVGEESDRITLTAKVGTNYFLYNKSDLIDTLFKELSKEVKSDYLLVKENIDYKINEVEVNKNKVDLTLSSKVKTIPKFADQELIKRVLGKNQDNLSTIFKTDFKVQGYDIVINQPLPLLKKFLPIFKNNINLTVSSL